MSTKNISRSAVEGGRATRSSDERKESTNKERAQVRDWAAHLDDFESERADLVPQRKKVRKEFTDKLNPCYRWLASRSGKPWSKVYKELKAKFDTRTLSAWHIVNQHMLTSVQGAGTLRDGEPVGEHRFYVDKVGLLRDRGVNYHQKSQMYVDRQKEVSEAKAKLKGRGVWFVDKQAFWRLKGPQAWVICSNPKRCKLKHKIVDETPRAVVEAYTNAVGSHRAFADSPHWRIYISYHFDDTWITGPRFTAEEVAWWKSLPPWLQSRLEWASRYVKPVPNRPATALTR